MNTINGSDPLTSLQIECINRHPDLLEELNILQVLEPYDFHSPPSTWRRVEDAIRKVKLNSISNFERYCFERLVLRGMKF